MWALLKTIKRTPEKKELVTSHTRLLSLCSEDKSSASSCPFTYFFHLLTLHQSYNLAFLLFYYYHNDNDEYS